MAAWYLVKTERISSDLGALEDDLVLMLSGRVLLFWQMQREEQENPETGYSIAIDPDIPNSTVTANRLERTGRNGGYLAKQFLIPGTD